jgi:hypothetical protein
MTILDTESTLKLKSSETKETLSIQYVSLATKPEASCVRAASTESSFMNMNVWLEAIEWKLRYQMRSHFWTQ